MILHRSATYFLASYLPKIIFSHEKILKKNSLFKHLFWYFLLAESIDFVRSSLTVRSSFFSTLGTFTLTKDSSEFCLLASDGNNACIVLLRLIDVNLRLSLSCFKVTSLNLDLEIMSKT
ncbi:hypothetical protein BpHYR1_039413 [Brachionus plicatilis]|uniref:Uncharacterized protein n=1 Tax=Brachionus plicatilis TaxID=10195 RepID=A0A3M7R3Q3_BRAPC|nr:hypothetical protein BpHYR1_039413 [Brachionus plicatilis]